MQSATTGSLLLPAARVCQITIAQSLFFNLLPLALESWSIASHTVSERPMSSVSYNQRLLAAFALPGVCAFYVAAVVRKLRPGWPRLIASVPIFVFNFCCPALFDENTQLISKLILNLCFVWLSNFKVFALCLDRGALSRLTLSPAQFYAIYVAPITPRDELEGNCTVRA